jgi:hypothetical protein
VILQYLFTVALSKTGVNNSAFKHILLNLLSAVNDAVVMLSVGFTPYYIVRSIKLVFFNAVYSLSQLA